VITLPSGKISVPLDSVLINPPAVCSVLAQFNPELILKGFPEHDPADTIVFNEFGQVVKKLDLSLIYKIRLPEGASRDSLIGILDTLPEVIYAEPNGTAEFYSPVFPNDQHFGKQWGLYNTGQSGGVTGADIKAPDAWEIFQGSSSVKIGIIDLGVYGNHLDLSGKVSGDAGYSDPHGTHVAGIASAKTNNSIGVAGVDWNAHIISQNISGQDITGLYNSILDAVNAGANVLNNSWGLIHGYSTTIRSAFAYAYKMNRASVVSMGNDYLRGNPIKYPAAFGQGIIAVGATTEDDVRSAYSSTGNHIDVVAPGGINQYPDNNLHDIYSCWYGEASYRYVAGTSMASPFVTGLVSLLKGYKSNLYNDDIEQIIRISADDKGDPGWDSWYGTGRINARKALEFLQFPYSLVHSDDMTGYNYDIQDVTMTFYDTPGFPPGGSFSGLRYEVRKTVGFPYSFVSTPYVWGRGVPTSGYSNENPNFGMGFCGVVPGSITTSQCELYTYCYYDANGWYPTYPVGVGFYYSALGEFGLQAGAMRSYAGDSIWINVSWNDAYQNESGYKLERKDATNNQWSIKATVGPNVTSYTDYSLRGSETYTYKVRGYNGTKYGTYSNEKVIKARPNPPTDFEAILECAIYNNPKLIPISSSTSPSPPNLYSEVPGGCAVYSNRVFLYWSEPVNQKLDIQYYGIKISEWGGPETYKDSIYVFSDTLCLKTNTKYSIYVYCVDSEGDTSNLSSARIITTGREDFCENSIPKVSVNIPKDFFLSQNYPNPFNLETAIEYGLPEDTFVKFVIYDVLGRKVRVLADEFQSAGVRNVYWDGKNDRGEEVGSGIYFYRIQTGSFTKTAKMSLLK
jgi:thermitase